MAKRKKVETMAPLMPSPKQQRKWAAENMARTVLSTMPKQKRLEDSITKAVMAAGEKASKARG